MMIPYGYKQTEVGVIPEDWKCVPLLSKCSLLNGLTYNPENVSQYGLLVIRSSNIQGSHLVFSDNVYVDLSVDSEKLIKKDDSKYHTFGNSLVWFHQALSVYSACTS